MGITTYGWGTGAITTLGWGASGVITIPETEAEFILSLSVEADFMVSPGSGVEFELGLRSEADVTVDVRPEAEFILNVLEGGEDLTVVETPFEISVFDGMPASTVTKDDSTWEDISPTLEGAYAVAESGTYAFFLSGQHESDDTNNLGLQYRLTVDGSPVGGTDQHIVAAATDRRHNFSCAFLANLTPGTYSIKAQWRLLYGIGTGRIGSDSGWGLHAVGPIVESTNVFESSPSAIITKSDHTTWTDMDTNLEGSFTTALGGDFLFMLRGQHRAISQATDVIYRLTFEGSPKGGTTQHKVSCPLSTKFGFLTPYLVTLAPGTYSVKVQWIRAVTFGTIQADTEDGWGLIGMGPFSANDVVFDIEPSAQQNKSDATWVDTDPNLAGTPSMVIGGVNPRYLLILKGQQQGLGGSSVSRYRLDVGGVAVGGSAQHLASGVATYRNTHTLFFGANFSGNPAMKVQWQWVSGNTMRTTFADGWGLTVIGE
jgi:hypothetical protein